MAFIVAASVLAFVGLGLVLRALVRQLTAPNCKLPLTAEWMNELSTERYRPMVRLFESDDLVFLRSQPGFTPRMETTVRKQRCRIAREYLRQFTADFDRTSTAIKLLMVQAKEDRPDLASLLVHSQLKFACGMAAVRCRLLLYRWGLGRVDISSLVKVFDVMRLELRSLCPAPVAASA